MLKMKTQKQNIWMLCVGAMFLLLAAMLPHSAISSAPWEISAENSSVEIDDSADKNASPNYFAENKSAENFCFSRRNFSPNLGRQDAGNSPDFCGRFVKAFKSNVPLFSENFSSYVREKSSHYYQNSKDYFVYQLKRLRC
ncbi:MAG: hypothetical protein SOZ02_06130 [Hallerella porci]|nr:hypothetical protein [Hallerella porci]MCI5601398.1 hypothetical protein [Hallerella sp.]MDY3921727.1 hypothetical protein [Hallerella porci]